MTTWYLSFRAQSPQREPAKALAAVQQVIPTAVAKPSTWNGNPRDFYSRSLDVSASSAAFTLGGQLGTEASMDAGEPDPSTANFTLVQLTLTGEDVEAMWAAWHQLATAFAAAGYDDLTTRSAPASIIEQLREAGQGARADALASQVTEALLAREAEHSPHDTSLSLSFTRASDLGRVLRAVTTPERITHLDLSHNDLERLPPEVLRFPALQWLNLQGNRLREPLPAPLTKLAHVFR